MSKRLLSKAWHINPGQEVLVDYAADQEGGEQIGFVDPGFGANSVPFGSANDPLADRKHLIMTIALDAVTLGGDSGVLTNTGYIRRGRGSGSLPVLFGRPPQVQDYSNRKQFLRGQYMSIALLNTVPVFAVAGAIEAAFSLELA